MPAVEYYRVVQTREVRVRGTVNNAQEAWAEAEKYFSGEVEDKAFVPAVRVVETRVVVEGARS